MSGAAPRRVLFSVFARMGDVCCAIPAFHALRRKFPRAELSWATLPQYAHLVPRFGIPVLDIHTVGFGGDPGKLPGYDLCYYVQPMHRKWAGTGKHIVNLIAEWAEVVLEPSDRRISVEIPRDAKDKVSGLGLPEKFVALCSSPTYSVHYPFQDLLEPAIRRCSKAGIAAVTVGGGDGREVEGALPLHGKLSIQETIAVIDSASAYLGPDGGVTWLACAASRAKKLCVLDERRLSEGVVGFASALEDPNLRDMFFQEGEEALLSAFLQMALE